MSNHYNPNYSQHLKAPCTRGARNYSSTGRPFTKADLTPKPLPNANANISDSCSWKTANNTTQDCSPYMCPKEYTGEGRPFNPFLDTFGNRSEKSQFPREVRTFNPSLDMSANRSTQQASQVCSRFNLDYEMAKNKANALEVLRAEEAKASCPRPTQSSSRGRQFDMNRELRRQQQQRSPNICARQGRDYINQGRPLDIDRIYNYDLQACSPTGPSGRPLDLQRDLTFRRKNLPTPKQRASSCPTPVQCNTYQTPVHGVSRICPRTSQSLRTSPTRSNSPPEQTECPTTKTSTTRLNKPADFSHQSFGDQTCRREFETSPQASTFPSPQGPSETTHEQFPQQSPKCRVQDTSHFTGDNSRQKDSVYGQTPPKSFAIRTPIRNPKQPVNVTNHANQRSFQKPSDSVVHQTDGNKTQLESMQRNMSVPVKNGTFRNITPTSPAPTSDSLSIPYRDLSRDERSMHQNSFEPMSTFGSDFNQSCSYVNDYTTLASETFPCSRHQVQTPQSNYQYRQSPIESSKRSYVDLTDDTVYQCDMDISGPNLTSRACPVKQNDTQLMNSWSIPLEDITCQECPRDATFSSLPPPFSSNFADKETAYDITEYRELPLSLKHHETLHAPAAICPPCEKPKASLFRCLADKLSSTYDFLSSFVASEKSAGPLPQEDNTMERSFDHKSCPYDTATFNLGNLYASQQHPDASTFGLNTLFGTKSQLRDTSPSLRECANAKRCGHVQFDSSDKSQVQNPQRSVIRKAEIENLVNDTYCPGIIQETIDGRENFNDYSFNISLSYDGKDVTSCERPPVEDPITLLEAFSMRIEKERTEINKDLSEEATEEQIEDSIHKYFAKQNPSDLNRSLKCLLISEHLQGHDQLEKSKGLTLQADVQKLITTFPENAKVKLICYTGHCRASEN